MADPGNLELLSRALGVLARHETVLEPRAFEELAHALQSAGGFAHLAVTRSERPGVFRVLVSTGGDLDQVLPYRTLLPSSRKITRPSTSTRRRCSSRTWTRTSTSNGRR